MATLTLADDKLRRVDEFAKKKERSREEVVDEAIDMYLRKNGRSKAEIVESLFGIIPNDGISLTELREERLLRYESND